MAGKAASRFHKAGKMLLCHTDGENRGLMDLYRSTSFDVAESFCPSPMTTVSLSEYRDSLGGEVCIWGGVPSVALLSDSFSDVRFEALLSDLAEEMSNQSTDRSSLILGVSDNVPPDANIERLQAISRLVFGM